MILPPLQMQPSRPPHEEQGQWRMTQLFLYTSSGEAVEQLEHEMQDSRKDQRVHTRNDTDSGHAKERRYAKQSAAVPNRAPRDQAERRKTTPEHGPC